MHTGLFKIALLSSLISMPFIAEANPTAKTAFTTKPAHYAIMVDAGSSGSRLHLFEITGTPTMPTLIEVFSENTKPGLSAYATHPEDAGASLKKLLDDAASQLQQNHIDPHSVSVSVLATAGMRLVAPETQTAIYHSVRQYLTNQTLFSVGKTETISGQMEGLYGWLDVNYLAHTFQSSAETVGSIDLGGASTQIAYATSDTSKPDDEITLNINRKTYTVFAKSFLGLGQDQALASLLKSDAASSCFPTGYSDTKLAKGAFNFASCQALYADVIQQKNVAQQLLPLNKTSFIAYSGVYYDLTFFKVTQTPDEARVDSQIQSTCSLSWEQLHTSYPNDKYLPYYCAHATYVSDLLYKTYQLEGSQLRITTQIDQHDIDWTLGALLYNLTQN